MSGCKLVYESKEPSASSKIYQDSEGSVRNPDNHDRFTLNTRNGGNVSGHGYNHEGKFDTSKGKNK